MWALAQHPDWIGTYSLLSVGWLTECSQHIFPFLASSCSYWLPHSLFGTTQHSCTNAVAWTDMQLCIESCRNPCLPWDWRLGICHIYQRIRHGSLPLSTFCYLLVLFMALMAPQGIENSQTAKTWKCSWSGNQSQMYPFHLSLKMRKEGRIYLEIWALSPALCYPQHLRVVWSALSGACMSIYIWYVNYLLR